MIYMDENKRPKLISTKTYLLILLIMLLLAASLSIPSIFKTLIKPAAKFTGTPSIIETNGTDHTLKLIGIDPGNYKYYVRCEDKAGNINQEDYEAVFELTETAVIIPTQTTDAQTSGGKGSSGKAISYSVGKSLENNQLSFTDIPISTGIKEIIIEPKNHVDKPNLRIVKLETLPEYVTKPSGAIIIYSYLIIESSLEIKKAVVDIDLPETWLKENYIGKVVLLRYSNDEWQTFTTAKTELGLYRTEILGFSVFAVAGEITPQSVTKQLTTEPTTQPIQPSSESTEESKEATKKPEQATPSPTSLPILVVIVAIIGSIIIYFIKFKRP